MLGRESMGPSPSELASSFKSILRSFTSTPPLPWRPPHSTPSPALHNSPDSALASAKPSPAPHLPPEIIDIIFEYLNPSSVADLVNYARISRSWLPHARARLYKSIVLRIEERDDAANGWLAMSADASDAEIQAQMLDCVARRAVLLERTVREDRTGAVAESVAELNITLSNHAHVFEIGPVALLLQSLARRCTSLATLSLAGANAPQYDALLAALTEAALHLNSFAIVDGFDKPERRPGPSALDAFLHSQRATLKELSITRSAVKPFSFVQPSGLAMPALTTLRLTSSCEWRHGLLARNQANDMWRLFHMVSLNSLDTLTALAVDLAWDLDLDRFTGLTDLTLNDNQHQLFNPFHRPHPHADTRTLQRPVRMPPSITALRVRAIPPSRPLSQWKQLSVGWQARPEGFEWGEVVPSHVEVLDLGRLLVHPASLARWLTAREAGGRLRRVEWGVPAEGWEVVNWGLERRAEELKAVCGKVGIEWVERPVRAWIDE